MKLRQREEAVSLSGFLQEGEEVGDSGCQTLVGLSNVQCTPFLDTVTVLGSSCFSLLQQAPHFLVFYSVSGPTRDGGGYLFKRDSQCSGNSQSQWRSGFPALLDRSGAQCYAFFSMLLVCLQCWKPLGMKGAA